MISGASSKEARAVVFCSPGSRALVKKWKGMLATIIFDFHPCVQ